MAQRQRNIYQFLVRTAPDDRPDTGARAGGSTAGAAPVDNDDEDQRVGEEHDDGEHQDNAVRNRPLGVAMQQFIDSVKETIDGFGYRLGNLSHAMNLRDFVFTPPNPTMVDVNDVSNFELLTIVVWIPNVVWNRFLKYMPCPTCGDVGRRVTQDGWAAPRFVVGIDRAYFLLGKKYICRNCADARRKCRFRSYNPDAVAHLPTWMQWQMPAYVGRKTAISHVLLDLLCRQPCNGQSFRDFANMVRELNVKNYWRLSGIYYSFAVADRLNPTIEGAAWYLHSENAKVAEFSAFRDPERYMGRAVSVGFLIKHYMRYAFSRWNFVRKSIQRVGGKYLRGDHSFKLVKKMVVEGERPFVAIYSVMNEYSEIVGYWFCRTKSQKELTSALSHIEARYKKFGYKRIELWFTDDVDAEVGTLSAIFPSLRTEWKPSATFYQWSGNTVVCDNATKIASATTELKRAAAAGEKLGMDAEWNVNRRNGRFVSGDRHKTATLQLCTSSTCYIIHLCKVRARDWCDTLAKEILTSADITKVRRLSRHNGHRHCYTNPACLLRLGSISAQMFFGLRRIMAS